MTAWRLVVFDVPAALGGLLSRHRFRPTRKNPAHWYRVFELPERAAAATARAELRAAGMAGKWSEVPEGAAAVTPPRRRQCPAKAQPKPHNYPPDRSGFGGALNARPSSGSWRLKKRRRP